eukprot:403335319
MQMQGITTFQVGTGWSAPLHVFSTYSMKRGRRRPGRLNTFVPLLALPVNTEKAWVYGQDRDWVLYYNPQLHDQLSMELLCQMIEKYQYDYHAKEYENMALCCRVDYHFKVHSIEANGKRLYRENLEPVTVGSVLLPNQRISIGFHMHFNQNVFCCCKENGCNIF